MNEFNNYFGHRVLVNEQVNDIMIEVVPIVKDDIVVNENETVKVDVVYVSDEDVSLMKQGILLELYIHIQTGIKLFLEFFSIYLF